MSRCAQDVELILLDHFDCAFFYGFEEFEVFAEETCMLHIGVYSCLPADDVETQQLRH